MDAIALLTQTAFERTSAYRNAQPPEPRFYARLGEEPKVELALL